MGIKASEYIVNLQKKLNKSISPDEVIEHIKSEITEIDNKLHEADGLRAKKIELNQILRDLGDNSIKRKRLSPQAPPIELDDNSDEMIDIRKKICDALNQYGPLTNRQVIQKVGNYNEERKYFRAIKVLGERDIIQRDSDKKLIPGVNWDKRNST